MRKAGVKLFSVRGQIAFPIGRGRSIIYLTRKVKNVPYKLGITVKTSEVKKLLEAGA